MKSSEKCACKPNWDFSLFGINVDNLFRASHSDQVFLLVLKKSKLGKLEIGVKHYLFVFRVSFYTFDFVPETRGVQISADRRLVWLHYPMREWDHPTA